MFIKSLLGIGFYIGWKADEIDLLYTTGQTQEYQGERVVPPGDDRTYAEIIRSEALQLAISIGILLTVLLCWTLALFLRSSRNRRELESTREALEQEKTRSVSTASELHMTHQQLSTASGQLDGIIQGTTDFIAAIDTNYRFISFNKSFKNNIKKLFEVDLRIGMSVDEALALYPERIKQSKQLWARALEGEKFTAEQEFSENLDETFYYEITYTPIKNDAGEIIGASQICRDVTERNLIAENLKRERDFASAIFDYNSSLILVLDREGRIIRFNSICEKISGYKEAEVSGRVFWNIMLPTEEIFPVKNAFQTHHSDRISNEYVNRWITKDEEIRYISWSLSAIKDENGINEFFVATGIDITEKREFETARQRMLEVFENSTDLIRISDLQGQIIYLNPAGRRMLGLSEDRDISRLKVTSCHPEWVNDLMNNVGIPNAVKKGSWLGETAVKTLDNSEIPTSQLVLAHRNKLGELEYFSTVIRDISEQKNLERKYAEARDAAIETTKLKSEFLASMSHEIRTPMNGIIGIAELLLNTELSQEQRDYAETIQKSGDSLLTIINDILDFSKLEAGKLKFDYIDFDLNQMVEETLELFAKNVSQKDVELCLLVRRDVPTALRGDPGRLRQVLTNLVNNAVKFTSEGEICIEIKNQTEGDRPVLHFSVSDTGIGISPEVQKNLFNAFTQADTNIASRFGGTGLGLAISKQLVGMMDGEIGVESKVDVGSTFWFTAAFDLQADAEPVVFSDPKLKNARTLVVANNNKLRDVLLYQTKSYGMLADEAGSAAAAAKLLEAAAGNNEPFDLVILDMALPEMKELELARRITTDPVHRSTRILLLPSIDERGQLESITDQRLCHFAVKPIKPTEFFNTVVRLFSENLKPSVSGDAVTDPAVAPAPVVTEHPISENGASTMKSSDINNRRILIAEDNLVNQKVILNQVTSLGFEVDLVENGQEALDAMQFKEYSLILMDCQMPVMDGFEATEKIRQAEKATGEHIPIIAVTAHAIEGDRERCLAKGMDDYISKPTKQQVLAEAIDHWINKSRSYAATEDQNQPANGNGADTEQPMSEADYIDSRLQELADDCGDEIVHELLTLFLDDTVGMIDILREDLDGSDFDKLAKDAHKMKGSAANMGARRMPAFCQKLIEFAKNSEPIPSRILLKQIEDEYRYLRLIYVEKKEFYEEKLKTVLTGV